MLLLCSRFGSLKYSVDSENLSTRDATAVLPVCLSVHGINAICEKLITLLVAWNYLLISYMSLLQFCYTYVTK